MAINNGRIQESIEEISCDLLYHVPERIQSDTFKPLGPIERAEPFLSDAIPSTLDELTQAVTRSYDLTVTSALDLKIPVVGSVGGGFNRRVVVLERAAFKTLIQGALERQYGYAVRLCLTVNKWNSDTKISLPFLAASAEIGTITAQWTLQVMGLSGPKIDQAILPPTELNVETFVIAKQSLENVLAAVRDSGTKFSAALIAEIAPVNATEREFRQTIVKAYAVSSLERGRTCEDARLHLSSDSPADNDIIASVYQGFAGLSDPHEKPSNGARQRAALLLGRLRIDIPWLG